MSTKGPGVDWLPHAARLALQEAPLSCRAECRSYHAIWPLLRGLGDLPSVGADHAFLTCALGAAAADGKTRVLISGAADHGILAYVIDAFERVGSRPEITVIDRCATPLALCTAYGREKGLNVTVEDVDILSFSSRNFDLIVAHNFLNFFDPRQWQNVFETWRGLLEPSGRLVTLSTISPDHKGARRRFSGQKARDLEEQMVGRLEGSPYAPLISEAELRALVTCYADRHANWRVTHIEQITDLIARSDLVPLGAPDQNRGHDGRIRVGFVAVNPP